MKCPKCQHENPQENRYCRKCGKELLLSCSKCGAEVLSDDLFCGKCGQELRKVDEITEAVPETGGERKYVTVLFSDLSGYTAMSERLDPEEVKEITSGIFAQISEIISKYEGFVEKFVGDAVMALFGVPKVHEDDPIRAIKVAREIHELVDALSPDLENRIGQPISMHTGINTGLVVTGDVDMEKGTHGVAGDTINLASRLSSLANEGEILVGPDTYRQAEGHFTFGGLEPTTVKGKAEPIQVHKVLSPQERPVTIHRLSGLRSELIGRKAEVARLRESVENLRQGKGRILSVCGDAGTGKSRLIEEFKATLDLQSIQWLEGHAYAYSQNIPYFPLIDLLNRVFHIEEGDPQEKVREKVESGIESLVGKKGDVVPYVGSLYSLSYPEVEDVSPEFWKSRLQEATQTIISALAQRARTVFFLEDLHWADPSFLELLRHTLLQVRQAAIVLCVYRPTISLFTSQQLSGLSKFYEEILLQDLSLSEAQDMLESLLKTEVIPSDLKRFVQDKVEGNPFYIEEVINSLIETETLAKDNGGWKVTRPISEADISSSIHGVISGRLDRLEIETKRILQEASVIGRAFLYDILTRVTDLKTHIDKCLSGLERLDLIKTRSLQPDLEYIFKHALTQEVVYSGLLKKERQAIHERVGLVMEELFQDRLPEFYETLSFHFKQSHSDLKAVDYLMKAGEKSLKRYALDEADKYFEEAFDIVTKIEKQSEQEKQLLIDIFIKWALVFYYRGAFRDLTNLLESQIKLVESLDDMHRLGMFYAWYGFALACRNKTIDSYEWLKKSLQIGEKSEDDELIGYACTWLTWTCSGLGRFDEAIGFGKRAQEISKLFKMDQYLYFKSLAGIGFAYYFLGDNKNSLKIGKELVDFGQRHSNMRSLSMGHGWISNSYDLEGNLPKAIEYGEKFQYTSIDPFYFEVGRAFLGVRYASNGQIDEAEKSLQKTLQFNKEFGIEFLEPLANIFLGVVYIAKGRMSYGLNLMKEGRSEYLKAQNIPFYCLAEYSLGKVYLEIAKASGKISPTEIIKNIGFIVKNAPRADKKAITHFNKAIEVAKEIGSRVILGLAYFDLGVLHQAKKRTEKARQCISEAVNIFEQCEANAYLKQAKEALESLE